MKKLVGIFAFLAVVYGVLLFADEAAQSATNHFNLARRVGLYGIVSLGAGLLIITGGIDLSIGSVVCLSATLLAMMLRGDPWPWPLSLVVPQMRFPPVVAIPFVMLLGAFIGWVNGILVTKIRVQAFVVTLCGLFVYRGAARWLAKDTVKGLANDYERLKYYLYSNTDVFGLPMSFVIFLVLAGVATVFLHLSIYGRYYYAIGSNERAARYSGVATDRYKISAYVLCSTLAAFYGILILMQENSSQPSTTGGFLELYAIAGAVLGGCSLRGGEGSIVGIIAGATILVLLPNLTNMWGIESALEFTVIGGALLLGAILDELLKRRGRAG
jgi:ribose transport system permease protein